MIIFLPYEISNIGYTYNNYILTTTILNNNFDQFYLYLLAVHDIGRRHQKRYTIQTLVSSDWIKE